jgi:hypothetical protein
VLYPDRLLRSELIPDFAELDDSEIVARAQELEASDRAKLAEVGEAHAQPVYEPGLSHDDVDAVDLVGRPDPCRH